MRSSRACGIACSRSTSARTAETVARQIASEGSLIGAIESLRGGSRSLEPLACEIPELADELLPDASLVDPEAPVSIEELADQMLPPDVQRGAARRGVRVLLLFATVLALAAAWRWTPMQQWLDVRELVAMAAVVRDSPYALALVIALYVVGSLLVVPLTLLLVATLVTFGPWEGTVYALLGAQASAMTTYGIGRLLGRSFLQRFGGRGVNRLSRRLGGSGVLAVFVVRMVPVAPFTLVNMVAGASHIRARDFALGNFLGLVPGTLALGLFADRAVALVRQPDLAAIVLLAVVIVASAAALIALRRWVTRSRAADRRKSAE